MKNIINTIFAILLFCSCSKQNEWLDAKRQKEMVIPETFRDYQAILDIFEEIHNKLPIYGQIGSDDFYLTESDYNRLNDEDIRNGYTWNKEIWSRDDSPVWSYAFAAILKSNVVLDGLQKIKKTPENEAVYNNLEGQAYFYRALFYHNLTQLFCKAFSKKASLDLGLPIRITSDVNVIRERATLLETYSQIISDAQKASELLPIDSENNRRPCKAAALGLLAKVYLAMGDYKNAEYNADLTLQLHGDLLNYNSGYAQLSRTYRFPAHPYDHPEILFYGCGANYAMVMPIPDPAGSIDNDLYAMYSDNDLRKQLFFVTNSLGQVKYRGSYTGSIFNFCGIATNEIYFIRAESRARLGKNKLAIEDLNAVLKMRYKTNYFTELQENNNSDLLGIILKERRKELVGVSNIRWEDLKRLNTESQFQKVLIRVVNGEKYILEPNSLRYVLPIPKNEIEISNIIQNER